MKVGDPSKVQSTRPVVRARRSSGVYETPAIGAPRPISDTISVMGIPAEEMTPKVQNAIMTLMGEVDRLRNELDNAHQRIDELERLVDMDPLVPISNRRAFVREVTRAIAFAERYNVKSSLIFFDVNNMKTINDSFGHAAGDAALMHIAETLKKHLRDLDVVGRLGGDEFGVMLAQTDEEGAHLKAVELADEVEKNPIIWQGKELVVHLAHGAYTFGSGQSANEALAGADEKMYINKQKRKSQE